VKKPARFRPFIYVTVFLVLAGIFFIVTFPDEKIGKLLIDIIGRETGSKVTLSSASYSPPFALRAKDLKVKFEGKDIVLDRARISVSPFSMFSDRKRFGVELAGEWGRLVLGFNSGKDLFEITARTGGIDIARLPLQDLPVGIDGRLIVDGGTSVSQREKSEVSGSGKITIENVTLSGGYLEALGLGTLAFDSGKAFWSVIDNNLTIGENAVSGDINGKARGGIIIDPADPGRSRLDIALTMRPSDQAAARLSPLFSLAGKARAADGSVTVKIGGTFDNPRYSL